MSPPATPSTVTAMIRRAEDERLFTKTDMLPLGLHLLHYHCTRSCVVTNPTTPLNTQEAAQCPSHQALL